MNPGDAVRFRYEPLRSLEITVQTGNGHGGRGIFFVQHGSWNRTVPIGARVSFASLKPDGTGDKAEVFAGGWLSEMGAYDGRPVDVAQLPDGSLLVSDDFAGALYRITYDGDEATIPRN